MQSNSNNMFYSITCCTQSHSGIIAGGGQGAEWPAEAFHQEFFVDLQGKDRQDEGKKTRKWRRKEEKL